MKSTTPTEGNGGMKKGSGMNMGFSKPQWVNRAASAGSTQFTLKYFYAVLSVKQMDSGPCGLMYDYI